MVAPSRARGLKQMLEPAFQPVNGRAFTGAGIETNSQEFPETGKKGRAFTGAGIETKYAAKIAVYYTRSRLHGRGD